MCGKCSENAFVGVAPEEGVCDAWQAHLPARAPQTPSDTAQDDCNSLPVTSVSRGKYWIQAQDTPSINKTSRRSRFLLRAGMSSTPNSFHMGICLCPLHRHLAFCLPTSLLQAAGGQVCARDTGQFDTRLQFSCFLSP